MINGLASWVLLSTACQGVDRPPKPDPATFMASQIDTALEEVAEVVEEEPRMGGTAAPVVRTARIDPKRPIAADPLEVLAETYDPDGDLLRTSYRWFINDKPLSGATGTRLTPGSYHKGDLITVEVSVTDGPNDTTFVTKAVEIGNSPPVMTMPPRSKANLDGLRISVEDPDDDPITFSLVDPPPGLTIDAGGVLHFTATDELEETTTFQTRIIAEDPEGEQAIWELTMTLNPATPATRKYTPGREPPPEEPVEEAEEERRR